MLALIATALCGGAVLVLLYHYTTVRRPPGFPPGPPILPIVGSVPFLKMKLGGEDGFPMIDEEMRLSKVYGPIFSVAFGMSFKVIITDYKLLKEAFVKLGTKVAGRPDIGDIAKEFNPFAPIPGIVDGTYDDQWKLQHQTVLQVLRNLGYNNDSTAARIQEESDILIDNIRNLEGKPFNMAEYAANVVSNILFRFMFGERYELDDVEFRNYKDSMQRGFLAIERVGDLSRIPTSFLYPSFNEENGYIFKSFEVVNNFISKKLKENPPGEDDENVGEPRNFIEGYRQERKKNPATEDRIFQVMSDFLQVGFEVTNSTLNWCIYFMITYPEIQKKVQDELDSVVGRARKPGLSDKGKLPYTMATLHEVQRLSAVAPTGLSHTTITECKVGGYTLPKDTEVLGHLMAIMRDPDIWEDPLVLKPERFLDDEGRFRHREEYVPFGLGRRSCLGQQLANQEIFIFFSNLLHTFTFTPDGEVKRTARGVVALTHRPPDYKVIGTLRD